MRSTLSLSTFMASFRDAPWFLFLPKFQSRGMIDTGPQKSKRKTQRFKVYLPLAGLFPICPFAFNAPIKRRLFPIPWIRFHFLFLPKISFWQLPNIPSCEDSQVSFLHRLESMMLDLQTM